MLLLPHAHFYVFQGSHTFFRRILRTYFSRGRKHERRKRHKVSIIKIQASLPVATMERILRQRLRAFSYLHFFLEDLILMTVYVPGAVIF